MRAFNTWLDAVDDIARQRAAMAKVVTPGPSKAFNAWVERWEEGCRLRIFGTRMVNGALVKVSATPPIRTCPISHGWTVPRSDDGSHERSLAEVSHRRVAGGGGYSQSWNQWNFLVSEWRRLRRFGKRMTQQNVSTNRLQPRLFVPSSVASFHARSCIL